MSAGDELFESTLGACRIESTIGARAAGIVFRALRDDGPRPVALEVPRDDLSSIRGPERRSSRQARARKNSKIVQVLDFGVEERRRCWPPRPAASWS